MGEFGADTARYANHHPWTDRLARDADIGAARHGSDMRLNVFHYPIESWVDAVVMNVLMGHAVTIQLEEFSRVSYQPLAETFRAIAKVERYHRDLGEEGLGRILESPAGRAEAVALLAYWRPRVAASFGTSGSERFDMLKRLGLRHRRNEEMLADWQSAVDALVAKHGLAG